MANPDFLKIFLDRFVHWSTITLTVLLCVFNQWAAAVVLSRIFDHFRILQYPLVRYR